MISNSEITLYMKLGKKLKTEGLSIKEQSEYMKLKDLYNEAIASNPKTSVDDKDILRINELSAQNKSEGLTEEEEKEYVTLRLAYVISYKNNIAKQVNNIDIVDENGKTYNVGERYGKK